MKQLNNVLLERKKTIACTFYNDFNSPLDLASGVKKEKHGNYCFAPKYELKVCSLTQKKEWDGRLKIKLGRIHKLEFNVKSISINKRKDD
jgi:hypothetical protein